MSKKIFLSRTLLGCALCLVSQESWAMGGAMSPSVVAANGAEMDQSASFEAAATRGVSKNGDADARSVGSAADSGLGDDDRLSCASVGVESNWSSAVESRSTSPVASAANRLSFAHESVLAGEEFSAVETFAGARDVVEHSPRLSNASIEEIVEGEELQTATSYEHLVLEEDPKGQVSVLDENIAVTRQVIQEAIDSLGDEPLTMAEMVQEVGTAVDAVVTHLSETPHPKLWDVCMGIKDVVQAVDMARKHADVGLPYELHNQIWAVVGGVHALSTQLEAAHTHGNEASLASIYEDLTTVKEKFDAALSEREAASNGSEFIELEGSRAISLKFSYLIDNVQELIEAQQYPESSEHSKVLIGHGFPWEVEELAAYFGENKPWSLTIKKPDVPQTQKDWKTVERVLEACVAGSPNDLLKQAGVVVEAIRQEKVRNQSGAPVTGEAEEIIYRLTVPAEGVAVLLKNGAQLWELLRENQIETGTTSLSYDADDERSYSDEESEQTSQNRRSIYQAQVSVGGRSGAVSVVQEEPSAAQQLTDTLGLWRHYKGVEKLKRLAKNAHSASFIDRKDGQATVGRDAPSSLHITVDESKGWWGRLHERFLLSDRAADKSRTGLKSMMDTLFLPPLLAQDGVSVERNTRGAFVIELPLTTTGWTQDERQAGYLPRAQAKLHSVKDTVQNVWDDATDTIKAKWYQQVSSKMMPWDQQADMSSRHKKGAASFDRLREVGTTIVSGFRSFGKRLTASSKRLFTFAANKLRTDRSSS